MKKILCLLAFVPCLSFAMADPSATESADAYFKFQTLELVIPFKTVDVVSLYDFVNKRPLVGGETTIARAFNILSATVGVVTSAEGNGAPLIGFDLYTGNILSQYVNLGPLRIGGFGSRDFRRGEWGAGLKASVKLW
jgi:hypothetical protein